MIPEKFHYYLTALAKAHTQAQTKRLIESADPRIIKIICEIALNILNGNVELSNRQLQKLSPRRHCMRKLVNKSFSLGRKRQLLSNQKGGFLPLLISTLAGGILGSIFNT